MRAQPQLAAYHHSRVRQVHCNLTASAQVALSKGRAELVHMYRFKRMLQQPPTHGNVRDLKALKSLQVTLMSGTT